MHPTMRCARLLLSLCGCGARSDLSADENPRAGSPAEPRCRPGDPPEVLTVPAVVASRLLAYGDDVYLMDSVGDTIYRRSKDPAGEAVALIDPAVWSTLGSGIPDCCLDMAIDASRIYFTAFPYALTVPRQGGTPTYLLNADAVDPKAIAIDAAYLYLYFGDVLRVPIAGGPATSLASLDEDPYSYAVDDTHLYFTFATLPDGRVGRLPLAGGAAEILAVAQTRPQVVRADGPRIYWANQGEEVAGAFGVGSAVMALDKAGGTPRVVAAEQGVLSDLALDETHLYWVNTDTRAVMRAAKDGGAPEVIAQGTSIMSFQTYLSVDDSCVYWTERAATGPAWIVRAPK